MPRISERGTLSGSSSWNIDKLSNMMWSFFNIVYFYFRSLLDPLLNAGNDSRQGSRSSTGRGNPPRPPGRGNFRTFSDTVASPGYFPPPGG